MTLIVCLDDRNGMAFNGRRQSRDVLLCERILSVVGEKNVCMRPYSQQLFPARSFNVCTCEQLSNVTDRVDYYFVETDDPLPLLKLADEVIVYRWNRTYPADLYFPFDILSSCWTLDRSFDFPGNSHEQITEEVYRR